MATGGSRPTTSATVTSGVRKTIVGRTERMPKTSMPTFSLSSATMDRAGGDEGAAAGAMVAECRPYQPGVISPGRDSGVRCWQCSGNSCIMPEAVDEPNREGKGDGASGYVGIGPRLNRATTQTRN